MGSNRLLVAGLRQWDHSQPCACGFQAGVESQRIDGAESYRAESAAPGVSRIWRFRRGRRNRSSAQFDRKDCMALLGRRPRLAVALALILAMPAAIPAQGANE